MLAERLAVRDLDPRPVSSPAVRVTIVTLDTVAMLGRASPRKPRVAIDSRSRVVSSLLVANRLKARTTSSAGMPEPLSTTLM